MYSHQNEIIPKYACPHLQNYWSDSEKHTLNQGILMNAENLELRFHYRWFWAENLHEEKIFQIPTHLFILHTLPGSFRVNGEIFGHNYGVRIIGVFYVG